MRASVTVEKLGIPTVSLVCKGFELQAGMTAAGFGMSNLPISVYPGFVSLHSVEEMQRNAIEVMVDQVISGLTVQPEEGKIASEPGLRDGIFTGTFEAVNSHFYMKEWSDGLPVVPPSVDKIEEFLKYTDSLVDRVIGTLLPEKREATVWNIAVNGVMAGCRPEYMPVLTAIVEAMTDPQFGQEHLGHTPGTEILITVNGPIIKDLGFNYGQGALRVGYQANTSIGRFWRLYLRNVAGFIPGKTDKATFGGTWRVVLAEDEDACASIGWEPMSVDQGFKAGDNVVTVMSCTSTDSVFGVGADNVEDIMNLLADRIVDIQLYLFKITLDFPGPAVRPRILMSPGVARAIAAGGYSKQKVKQYLYEHAVFPTGRFEKLWSGRLTFRAAVERGRLPQRYCESEDPARLVPIVGSPDDFIITVSGDPDRDNCLICGQNGFIGYPVSKRIELPARWQEKLKEAKTDYEVVPKI